VPACGKNHAGHQSVPGRRVQTRIGWLSNIVADDLARANADDVAEAVRLDGAAG